MPVPAKGNKRKRSVSPVAGDAPAAPATPSASTSKRSRMNDGTAQDAGAKVEVVYQLVGTDKTHKRTLADPSLDDAVLGVARGLGVPFLGLRFMHVRTPGVETDVWDDFDFRTIRERAVAQGSTSEIIRVYSDAWGQTPAPSRAASFSPLTAVRHDPRATESAPATVAQSRSENVPSPRSALRSSDDGTPRPQKRVVLSVPSDTPPATPSPVLSARARRRNKKRSSQGATTSPTQPASLSRIETLAAKHKPARPSPLGQSPASSPQSIAVGNGKDKAPTQLKSKRVKPNPPPARFPPVVGTLPPSVISDEEGEPSVSTSTSSPEDYMTSLLKRSRQDLEEKARLAAQSKRSSETESAHDSAQPSSSQVPTEPTAPAPAPIQATAATPSDPAQPSPSPSTSQLIDEPVVGTASKPLTNVLVAPGQPKAPARRGPKPKSKAAGSGQVLPVPASPPPPPPQQLSTEPAAEPSAGPAAGPASEPAAASVVHDERSKKVVDLAPEPVAGQPAGEPHAQPTAPVEPPKRKVGRPKKIVGPAPAPLAEPAVEPAAEPDLQPGAPAVLPKRKLGKAKAVVDIPPAPKKRGRPTKAMIAEREALAAKAAQEALAAEKALHEASGKSSKTAATEEDVQAPTDSEAPPKRRGRAPKANVVDEASKAQATRGRATKAKSVEIAPGRSSDAQAEGTETNSDATSSSAERPLSGGPSAEVSIEAPAAVPAVAAKRGVKRSETAPAPSVQTSSPEPVSRRKQPSRASVSGTATSAANAPAKETADATLSSEHEPMEVDGAPGPAANGHAVDEDAIEAAAPASASSSRTGDDDGSVSDLEAPPVRERGTSDALQEPETCPLCEQVADHSPKDCPVVLAGVDRVRERFEERRQQLIKAGIKPIIKSDATLDTCRQWITRLTKVASVVVNGTTPRSATTKSSPTKPAPAETSSAKLEANPAPNGPSLNAISVAEEATPASTPAKTDRTPRPLTAAQRFAAANGGKSPNTPKDNSDSESSDDEATPSAQATGAPATPDTPFYPQSLHMMAAARAARRPGSSRLSVSDAVIETGDSSDSDSSEATSDSNSEAGSSIDSDSEDSSSDSDSSAVPDNLDSEALLRQIMTQPLSQRQRAEAARTAASMHAVSQEDIAEASDATDSEEEITLPRPTQRRGSDSSIGDFVEGEDGSANSAHLDDEDSEAETRSRLLNHVVAATQAKASVATNAPDAVDVDDDKSDEAHDGGEDEEEHYSEDDIPAAVQATPNRPASPPSFSSARSFARLAASSPILGDLPGDIALREAIHEDAAPMLDGPGSHDLAATQVSMRAPLPSSSQPGTQKVLQSPKSSLAPSSQPAHRRGGAGDEDAGDASDERDGDYEEERSPTPPPPKRRGRPPKNRDALPASQPTLRSKRQVTREPKAPASQPMRVTRSSSSRDLSPQRVTRSASSNAARSSSQRATRSSARLSSSPLTKVNRILPDSEEEGDEESDDEAPTPRPSQARRGFPSSRTRGPPVLSPSPSPTPSPARSASPSSSVNASQSVPVPATQSSPLRRRTRGDPETPLFMTQPSQMPATQAYHSIPAALMSEESETAMAKNARSDSDADSDVESHHSGHSDHSEASQSDASGDGFPIIPKLRPSSQPAAITSSFPTLSSLPKDLLRQGVDGVQSVWNRVTGKEGPAREVSSDESSDGDDSSDEDVVPERLRSRFAGGSRSAKKPRTRGVMRGW